MPPLDAATHTIKLLNSRTEKAFLELYDMYSDALYGVINRILVEEDVAKEALQDTFMKIWDNASKYNSSRGRPFTWMMQIARNTAIDYTRSAQYRKSKKTNNLPDFVSDSKQFSSNDWIQDSGLKNTIQQLDPKYSKLIHMAYYLGYSHSEIEKELDIPLGTIKTRIRKAITSLRSLLADEQDTLMTISFTITTLLF